MGEIERRIWKEIEENKELREILNKKMRETSEKFKNISFFSETFRRFHEKVAKGEIEIF